MTLERTRKVKEIADVYMGQSPPSTAVTDGGVGFPFLQGNAEFGARFPSTNFRCALTTRMARSGDYLLSVRAPVGALNQACEPTVFGRGLCALRISETDRPFVWHALRLASSKLNRVAQGSTFLAVSRTDVEDLEIPWLEEENQRIASVLDTVDALIDSSEAVLAKLRQVRAGLLHDLLTRGLDADGQLRDPDAHPDQFKDSPLGRIPREWEIKRVSELIAGFEAGVSVDSTDVPITEGEIGVLKSGCVTGGIFDPTQNKRVKSDHVARVRCNPRADSVIVSRMNTPQLVGESAYVPSSQSHVFLPDRLWQSVKLPGDPTCIRWLTHSIQTQEFRDLISGGATGTSGSMKNISQGFFLSLQLRTPAKAEQEAIAAHLDTHDHQIDFEQATLAKLRHLKSGLMTDLLEGRVRVPEDLAREAARAPAANGLDLPPR